MPRKVIDKDLIRVLRTFHPAREGRCNANRVSDKKFNSIETYSQNTSNTAIFWRSNYVSSSCNDTDPYLLQSIEDAVCGRIRLLIAHLLIACR